MSNLFKRIALLIVLALPMAGAQAQYTTQDYDKELAWAQKTYPGLLPATGAT